MRTFSVPRRHLPVILAATAATAGLAITLSAIVFHYGRPGFQTWADGSRHGAWRAIFNGEGSVGEQDGSILLRPRPARAPAETHAALVVSRATLHDFRLRVRLRTVAQLRRPAPNPWEVAWVVWAYTDVQHFYYLILKPNGWELGKRDPRYPGGQRFLATGAPNFPPGPWYEINIDQTGATSSIRVDEHPLTVHTDTETPYTSGRIGLYSEDAETQFRDLHF